MMTVLTQRALKYSLQALNRRVRGTGIRTVDYFAYGANMDAALLGKKSIFPSASRMAHLPDFEIAIEAACEWQGKGFASIRPAAGQVVYGISYRLTVLELAILDILEWVPFKFYRRELRQVIDRNGNPFSAWVYVACAPQSGLATPQGYRDLLVRAGEAAGFPSAYVEKLKTLPTAAGFSMDHGFRLSNATKRRLFAKQLHNAYRVHDNLREKLCQKLP